MQKKINKTQILATLALAFVLGLSAMPNSASAMSASDDSRATTVDPTDTTITDTKKDDWKLETASPEELVSAINSVKGHFDNLEVWNNAIESVNYLENDACKWSTCAGYKADIIKNVPAGTDTTGWDTKPTYELIPLAKATTDYDTNVALKAVVTEAENEISSSQLSLITDIHTLDSAANIADLKAKTIPELITVAKALPDYDKYNTLLDAYHGAIAFHASILPDAESGAYGSTAEAATYYNNLVAAAKAIDASFEVTPIALPETSVNTDTPAPTTKTPNTGIFGEGENKTAIAAVGGVAALGVVAGVIAARKTLKSKNRKARKF